MKLDRNVTIDGTGKYALVLMREIPPSHPANTERRQKIMDALGVLQECGVLDYGDEGTDSEFFVLRLRDVGAAHALRAYAEFFRNTDPEWFDEIKTLADKSYARFDRKMPD